MMYENMGQEKTLEDLLSTSTVVHMLRLKVTLLGLTKTSIEYKIIDYLCKGYKELDIADVLKVSRQHVNKTIKNFRKRLKTKQIEDIFSILKED